MSPPSPSPSWPPESAAEGGGGFGEIAFFDVETTVPSRPGAGFALLEFGAILVCPRRLVEVGCYSTLVRPSDLNSISAASQRCNGISRDAAVAAPSFSEVADRVFEVLHGRVWAGHNIVRFDCARIREAFAEIGRPAPEPKGMIDTLPLLTQRFGRRAGNMKMATLANYFGLGPQKHRSLDDVRMNLEVLKYCATVLFLESSLPDVFSIHSWASESPIMRNRANGSASPESAKPDLSPVPSLLSSPLMDPSTTLDVHDRAESSSLVRNEDTSDLVAHIEQMNIGPLDTTCGNGRSSPLSPDIRYITIVASEDNDCAGFLQADEVSVNCISVSQVPSHQNGCRLLLLHRDAPLQLCCPGLKVHFGISTKFVDNAGRPKLNIVVNIPANVHQVLDVCDRLAQKSSTDSGSRSEWRPLIRNSGYLNSSCIRLHIPTIANGDMATYSTEIYKKEPSGNIEKLVFSKIDSAVLELLFVPGTIIDTCFSVDIYDYQQYAGIRLVAKRLVVHSS